MIENVSIIVIHVESSRVQFDFDFIIIITKYMFFFLKKKKIYSNALFTRLLFVYIVLKEIRLCLLLKIVYIRLRETKDIEIGNLNQNPMCRPVFS